MYKNINLLEIGGPVCPVKVVAQTETNKKETLSQRLTNTLTKVIRTWTFVVCQLIFVVAWFITNHFFPNIAFDSSFNILELLLLTEICCIGSVFLMSQYRQMGLDRRITFSDYIVDCQIRHELKELRPMIESLYKDLQERNSRMK